MARILAHPLRFAVNGTLATVEQATDAAHAQQLAITVGTVRGERHLAPTFGITDPAFRGVDIAEVVAAVDAFGPPVTIADVTTRYDDAGGTAAVTIEFDS